MLIITHKQYERYIANRLAFARREYPEVALPTTTTMGDLITHQSWLTHPYCQPVECVRCDEGTLEVTDNWRDIVSLAVARQVDHMLYRPSIITRDM